MPELPEVEITTRKLTPLLKGKRILLARRKGGNLGWEKVFGVERRGKAILIWLASPYLLAFHMRMSGKLLVVERGAGDKHIRNRFKLSNGKDLVFHDVRKFGVVWYGPAGKVFKDNYFKTLGPDALAISFAELKNILGGKGGKIKAFLLNQHNIAGIGNIMADVILWYAKIHPETRIQNLKDSQIKKLWASLKFILNRSIKRGGSTMRDWLHPGGEEGGYFKKRFVYGRGGGKCFRCKSKILRKKIAGRSGYYCEKCQKP